MTNRYRSALFAAVAFVAGPAFAQTTPPADQPPAEATGDIVIADQRTEPDIIVAAGVPQYAREVGQAVTVITRATIEQRQAVSIADLIATTPGVTMSRNGPIGGFTAIRIRGAEGEQTLTIIDGVRVNDPSSPGGGFDFANLLAGSVDRVEILRGPNSVPWGSQALGGVVNIVTAAPSYGVQGRGSIEYGAHDSVFANAAISGANDHFSGALTAGYLHTDGISVAANGTEPDGYRQYGATGRVGINITQDIGLDLRAYYAHSRAALDGFPPPNYTLADDPEYSTTQELYGYAGVHANFLDGRFKNRVAFTIADINRDNFDPTFGTAPSFIGRGRSQRYEYQGDFQLIDQVRLVAGAEHEDTRFNDGSTFVSTGVTSFYGEAIVKPVRQVTVTGGIRHDQHKAYGSHTTFGADAVLALDSGTTIRASYGEGFKAPTLYQLYAPFYGFKDLKPETARNYDVGASQSFLGGKGSVGVTYFHRDTTNQIDFDLGLFAYRNIARTRANGVEFELTLRPINELTFTANYSYIHAENLSAGFVGKDLARRPRQTVNVSLDYKLPFGLSVGGTISHVGDSFDNAGNTTRLDGYVLAGVRAEMPIGDYFAVYGRVDNLFDERYQTVSGYGTLGRAAYGGVRVKL
ncbi:MAG: TonB-dependent receptor [Sphingomonas bacterium]|uniref:TonB-dependent receptor plug domain-containing protein n=1 Tax=Sphingomonas bacterium TaxID=1895847 RepID=UPI002634B64E|nr:TonB-dependent receptor [Sphingomonas bacterium]MDB5709222.1 TonB-dependent receptor [Sphingomonas bacterium]